MPPPPRSLDFSRTCFSLRATERYRRAPHRPAVAGGRLTMTSGRSSCQSRLTCDVTRHSSCSPTTAATASGTTTLRSARPSTARQPSSSCCPPRLSPRTPPSTRRYAATAGGAAPHRDESDCPFSGLQPRAQLSTSDLPSLNLHHRPTRRRRVTAFDLHATLRHLATWPAMPPPAEEATSLFVDLPDERSCEAARVPPEWCVDLPASCVGGGA